MKGFKPTRRQKTATRTCVIFLCRKSYEATFSLPRPRDLAMITVNGLRGCSAQISSRAHGFNSCMLFHKRNVPKGQLLLVSCF